MPSASTLSKMPNCFESVSLIKEENYVELQSANLTPYYLQNILIQAGFTEGFADNDEADSAVFVANLLNDSNSGLKLDHKKSTTGKELLTQVAFGKYLVEVRTQLKAAKKHLMPWLCSTTIMPDISLYKHPKSDLDLPIAIFEVISDTPWQSSRQLAIKLVELFRLFRVYGHDVPELTGVVLPRSKSHTEVKTMLSTIPDEESSNLDTELAADMFGMTVSDTGSGSQSRQSSLSQSFAVEVKVRFDCKQLMFVISYRPLQSTDVMRAVQSAPLDIEIGGPSNSNFLQLNEKELEEIRETFSADNSEVLEKYKGLDMSVALQQLYSRTALVFKAQTGIGKEIVLKVFARGAAEYMLLDNKVKKLKLQHALLSEGNFDRGTVGNSVLIVVFEYLPQLSKQEAKNDIRVALAAIKEAVDELHSRNIAHLDIRLPNICFKRTPAGLVAVLIDFERAKGTIKSMLSDSYNSCMYRTGWRLEDIDFLQVYWMALWLLLDDVHVSKMSYHSMDTLEASKISSECCKGLLNWIKKLQSPLLLDHWSQFLDFIK